METVIVQGNHRNKIVEEIKETYGVGDHFLAAYFQRWFKKSVVTESELKGVKNDPLLDTWFSFGLTTNQRGRLLTNAVREYMPKGARRYLDVGCGYGGFLVAFHELGLDVHGFELDPSLVPLSRANLDDYGIDPDKAQLGNVLDAGFVERLGTFDVITCNDVIEHVDNVELTLKNMARLLNSSGILLMQMPNKDFVNFINNDSHYNLFGITLLRHDDAERYHSRMFKDEYTVGEYYDYEYYMRRLNELGCEVHLLPPLYPQKARSEIVKDFKESFRNLIRFWRGDGKPGALLKLHITALYLKYAIGFIVRGSLSLLSENGRETFRRKYMRDFWFVMAVKK